MSWATFLTYERAPPQPERFTDANGRPLMTADDILAGKVGFQKADLMDYGSLYGMGSYYGQDFTAWTLIRLAGMVEAGVAQAQFGEPFEQLAPDRQAAVRDTMREQLQRIDLTQPTVKVPTHWQRRSSHCVATLRRSWQPLTPETGANADPEIEEIKKDVARRRSRRDRDQANLGIAVGPSPVQPPGAGRRLWVPPPRMRTPSPRAHCPGNRADSYVWD